MAPSPTSTSDACPDHAPSTVGAGCPDLAGALGPPAPWGDVRVNGVIRRLDEVHGNNHGGRHAPAPVVSQTHPDTNGTPGGRALHGHIICQSEGSDASPHPLFPQPDTSPCHGFGPVRLAVFGGRIGTLVNSGTVRHPPSLARRRGWTPNSRIAAPAPSTRSQLEMSPKKVVFLAVSLAIAAVHGKGPEGTGGLAILHVRATRGFPHFGDILPSAPTRSPVATLLHSAQHSLRVRRDGHSPARRDRNTVANDVGPMGDEGTPPDLLARSTLPSEELPDSPDNREFRVNSQ